MGLLQCFGFDVASMFCSDHGGVGFIDGFAPMFFFYLSWPMLEVKGEREVGYGYGYDHGFFFFFFFFFS